MPNSLAAVQAALDASPKSAGLRASIVVDYIRDGLDDAIDSIGIDAFITSVNALYDQYVAPIDVPWVPDVLEPTLIDAPAKQFLAALIRGFHARIHKD